MKQIWLGIHKLTEEAGELLQVLGKLNVFPNGDHPDDKGDLIFRLENEIADVQAAIQYLIDTNGLNKHKIGMRRHLKLKKFNQWGLTGVTVTKEVLAYERKRITAKSKKAN